MRGLLTGVGVALLFTTLGAPAATAQRTPVTYLAPSEGDERFLENWFGAELRTAGLKPLWTPRALEGYRTRYRLVFAGGGTGAMIVTVDIDQDGSGIVTQMRKRPGGIVERDQRAIYVPGRVAWMDRSEVLSRPARRLQQLFAAQHFFDRDFRATTALPEAAVNTCNDGIGILIEMRDRSGYNAVTRSGCDSQDVAPLVEAVMELAGGWPRY